jgi:hypothetical protein
VLSKSYFDGGNEITGRDANDRPYDVVTLAALSGLKHHWSVFEAGWRKILREYKVGWLHTTDAVGLCKPYSKQEGWDESKRDKFINRCVSVIEKSTARSGIRIGIRLLSVTIKLGDFKKALLEQPGLDNPAHVCSVHAVAGYYGYIHDRWKTQRVRKAEPVWERVIHVGEANMRKVPGLQAADLLAWSVNHAEQDRKIEYSWQERILNIEREPEIFDYEILRRPLPESINRMKGWRLPRRRQYK